MKKIYVVLFSLATLLASAPGLKAQSQAEIEAFFKSLTFPHNVQIDTTTSDQVGFLKDISTPDEDGNYWLKLEAFAKGEGIKSNEAKPSDIILVLDLSSSMSRFNYISNSTEYKALPSQAFTYNNYDDDLFRTSTGNTREANYFYKHTDDKFYEVEREQSGNTYYLHYTVGTGDSATTYYLSGTGTTTTRTGVNNAGSTIWTGVLYHSTRLDALIDATTAFVGSIYENDQQARADAEDFAGNRIAIITYNGSGAGDTKVAVNWTQVNEDITKNADGTYSGNMITSINGFKTDSGTRPDVGLSLAISDLVPNRRESASLTVLLFTDGYPVEDQNTAGAGSDASKFTWVHANNSIYYAHVLKDTYNANLFTVGMIEEEFEPDGAWATTANADNNNNFWPYRNYLRVLYLMDLLSSNYPDATIAQNSTSTWNITTSDGAISVSGLSTGDKDPEGNYFQLVDDKTDLSDIFDVIAGVSGSSPATGMTEESSAVDVVSSSFVLPDGTDADDIYVFTAPYKYNSGDGSFYFGDVTFAPYSDSTFVDYELRDDGKYHLVDRNADVDDGINVVVSTTDKKITVTGFDYADNWVGPVYKDETKTTVERAHGYKVIILIPVRSNPDAIGGPNVETNGDGSGLYDKDGKPLVPFVSPKVSLPVNLHINTTGLAIGESAKYTIKRKVGDGAWQYVTSVFVTRHKGQGSDDPIVYIKGLPPVGNDGEYIYAIEEDKWDWSYSLDSVTGIGKTGDVTISGDDLKTTDITTDLFIVNPITFNNSKTEGLAPKVRYSESKATNTFGTGSKAGVGYDDYKTNTKEGRADKIIVVSSDDK